MGAFQFINGVGRMLWIVARVELWWSCNEFVAFPSFGTCVLVSALWSSHISHHPIAQCFVHFAPQSMHVKKRACTLVS